MRFVQRQRIFVTLNRVVRVGIGLRCYLRDELDIKEVHVEV